MDEKFLSLPARVKILLFNPQKMKNGRKIHRINSTWVKEKATFLEEISDKVHDFSEICRSIASRVVFLEKRMNDNKYHILTHSTSSGNFAVGRTVFHHLNLFENIDFGRGKQPYRFARINGFP